MFQNKILETSFMQAKTKTLNGVGYPLFGLFVQKILEADFEIVQIYWNRLYSVVHMFWPTILVLKTWKVSEIHMDDTG